LQQLLANSLISWVAQNLAGRFVQDKRRMNITEELFMRRFYLPTDIKIFNRLNRKKSIVEKKSKFPISFLIEY